MKRVDQLQSECVSNDRAMLIVNADDWGRDIVTTDQIVETVQAGAVRSVSAMVFMADAERAAELARAKDLDAGLHLNFTTPLTSRGPQPRLLEHFERVRRFLVGHPWARMIFHPGLVRSFDYLVQAQVDEYRRLYGTSPLRIDGHHHMHLCANVRHQQLLPVSTIVRRNFTFSHEEKSWLNRSIRHRMDIQLARRHHIVDYLLTLESPPTASFRVFDLAAHALVELEVHPVVPAERKYLIGETFAHASSSLHCGSFQDARRVIAPMNRAHYGPVCAKGQLN